MRRRQALVASALGGFGLLNGTASAAQTPSASADRHLDRMADALTDLRDELRNERSFAEIAPVRTAQKSFLRLNGKLPDFIEVGVDIWFAVHDWHIRWQLPVSGGRDAQGRQTLAVTGTQVVLRSDVLPSYLGPPYDAR